MKQMTKMKKTTTKTKSLLFAALSLAAVPVLFTACSQEESVADGQGSPLAYGEYPLVITAGGMSAVAVPVTRSTVDGDWNGANGELVAVKIGDSETALEYKLSIANGTDNKTATLEGNGQANTYYWQSTSEEIEVSAWYPYSAEQPTEESITVKADQSTKAGYEASDVIATASTTMKFTDDTYSLQFSHLTAKIAVNLEPGAGMTDSDLSGATVTLLGLAGVVDDDGNEQNSVICKQPTTAGEGSTSTTTTEHLALVRPQVIAANTNFIQVNIGGSCYVAKFDTEQTFEANTAYTYKITVSKTGLEVTGSIGTWDDTDPKNGTAEMIERIVDLSELTGDYTVSGIVTLTGSTSYKITLAEGACVTLDGITITKNYIQCSGNATIKIADGSTNTITNSIEKYPGILLGGTGTTLEITGDTGELKVKGGNWGAGIGGARSDGTIRGNLLISGGKITATGGYDAAGIGSGYNNSTCGTITITGGEITATGGTNAAGIGSGSDGTCGTITITGGEVTATGGSYGAGIGSGDHGTCGNITINDGTVTATGGSYGAGIGSGYANSTCGDITIDGGEVTAKGGGAGAGIGSGVYQSTCGNILIDGGKVTAEGQTNGAGIGSGWQGTCGYITITGGTVTATKGSSAQHDIGKGLDGTCGTVTIGANATVNATSIKDN